MDSLIYMIPITIIMGLGFLAALLWSVRAGQYEDMDGAAWRILQDDDVTPTAPGTPLETSQAGRPPFGETDSR